MRMSVDVPDYLAITHCRQFENSIGMVVSGLKTHHHAPATMWAQMSV